MTAATLSLREIRLYGPLRAQFGRSHWLAVDSPAEAVRALCVLFKGFKEALLGHKGPGYRVTVGEGAAADDRTADTLTLGAALGAPVRIVPVLRGAKRQGSGQVIWGYILYAVGLVVYAYTNGTGGQPFIAAGQAMMIGGAIQMLSPQRRASGSEAEKEISRVIGGAVNVNSTGGPVPLIIGRMLVGSVTVSAGLATDRIAVVQPAPPPAPELPIEEPLDPNSSPGGDGSDGGSGGY